ncbi:MAG: fimbrillin family protein [Prevotella sp.]|nr:fimbrillin family protein [Prevotella sp.]
MMKRIIRTIRFFAVLPLTCMFVACSVDAVTNEIGSGTGNGDDRVPVDFSVSTGASGAFTRAASSIVSFNAGESVMVRVKPDGASSYTDYQFTTASSGQSVTLTAPTPPPYFPVGAGTTVQAYAYYPATAAAATTFAVAGNQTADADYKGSDLMYAENRTITKGSTTGTTLLMSHKMVQLCITANALEGSGITIKKVKVNCRKLVNFSAADGTATVTGDLGDIVALTAAGTGYVLLPAQPISQISILIETDDAGSADKTATFGFASDESFVPGNSYSIHLTVSPEQVGATTAISGWDGAGSVIFSPTGNLSIAAIPAQTYDGTAKTPALTVKKGDTPLVLDDANGYSVMYFNNVNAGNAYAVVMGKGVNDGTVGVASFVINKADAVLSLNTTAAINFADNQSIGATDASHVATFSGGTLTAVSSAPANCTVSVNQSTGVITVTRVSEAAFPAATITVGVTPDANHNAPANVTFTVSADAGTSVGVGVNGSPTDWGGTETVDVTVTRPVCQFQLNTTASVVFTESAGAGATDASHIATFSGGTLTAVSSAPANCTVSVNQSSGVITVTRVNAGAFSGTTITVTVAPDTNHTAPASVTFSVSGVLHSSADVSVGISNWGNGGDISGDVNHSAY